MGQTKVKVNAEPAPEVAEKKEVKTKSTKKASRKPKSRSKKYQNARTKIDKSKAYSVKEALKLLPKISYSDFNGTVELHLVVQKNLATEVELPHSTGKKKKVEIANETTIEKLKKGKIDFDILLATPDFMPKLVPFAQILGPKGLMPNPKNKTLVKNKEEAKKFSVDQLILKTEKSAPVIHTVVGKVKQKDKELAENIEAVLAGVGKRKIIKAYLCSTMSPSIRLETAS